MHESEDLAKFIVNVAGWVGLFQLERTNTSRARVVNGGNREARDSTVRRATR